MDLSIIVPTFNEAPNVAELVRRTAAAVADIEAEIIFVDDSTDDTPAVIRAVASSAALPVRVIHREHGLGGLGGAVLEGYRAAAADVCVVIDGDLQHPPESIPSLYARHRQGEVDVVVASRYAAGGASKGLADKSRVFVSKAATALTKAMFPIRLKETTDPMTGFFLVDRTTIDLDGLQPRGFKILLEILARKTLRVAEVPFAFAPRFAGESKASMRQGLHFLMQLTALRFGKMSLFAVVGGLGAVANVLIVWALTQAGVGYIASAIVAAEVTIIANFLLIERFVFQDMRGQASGVSSRFAKSFLFNNAEAVIRIPIVAFMVSASHISVVVATAITLVVAFFVRFVFHSLVVYAPKKRGAATSPVRSAIEDFDKQAMQPGEL
ncbi:glycosyltransferase family 2 protein [Microbacterium sp.]|uniref:glycosyltransferase n=1 Tax=Microbacterium sp. TaxID=51671 RepID=UPI0025DF3BEC|nr:glycosyltransferase family 2 protein [Microbacterium sp.]